MDNLETKMTPESSKKAEDSLIWSRASAIIQRYRIYYIVPIITFIIQLLLIQYVYFGCMICDEMDVRTFYFGIQNTFFSPELTYTHDIYAQNYAWDYFYLPFFALIFYPLTLWGIRTFEILFFLVNLIAFGIALIVMDIMMQDRSIKWPSRMIYLFFSTVGTYILIHILQNQVKFFVLLLIVLIIYFDQKKKPPWIIHMLFILLISMMTHLIFWYACYLGREFFQSIKKDSQNVINYKTATQRNKRYTLTATQKINILPGFKPILMAFICFIIGNILFLVQPVLIQGYYTKITAGFISSEREINLRFHGAIIPYIIYQFGFREEMSYMALIAFIVLIIVAIYKKWSLTESMGWNGLMILLINPFNEYYYYVFLVPSYLIWVGHNLGALESSFSKNSHIARIFDILLHILFFFTIIQPLYQHHQFNFIVMVLIFSTILILTIVPLIQQREAVVFNPLHRNREKSDLLKISK